METIWIWGNQLPARSDFLVPFARDKSAFVVLFIESRARGRKYPYHKHKLVLVYSAMRHFARQLEADGWTVAYHPFPETATFTSAWAEHLEKHAPTRAHVMRPSEYPAWRALERFPDRVGIPVEVHPNDLFLLDRPAFVKKAQGKQRVIMEYHYRAMRKRLDLLMVDPKTPVGGKWNYDAQNREPFSPEVAPGPVSGTPPDDLTRAVMKEVAAAFHDHPGAVGTFTYPVTREGALAHLQAFLEQRLDYFGPHEDMMAVGEPHLYHSVLSPLLNIGLLHPMEAVDAVVARYEQGQARLQSVEAMVRQLVGWREFIYGVYWTKMPAYASVNYLDATRPLPAFFWTGETPCACLAAVIQQAIDRGYLHHIQRLMVVANFCTLVGIDPRAVLEWFMALHVDAYDWVMLPNVYGMGVYADGGFMATKPYVSSGAYIHRMSNYCARCAYKVKQKTGPAACPFNYLFWYFLDQNAPRLIETARLGLMYKTLSRFTPEKRARIRADARAFLASLEEA